MHLDKQKPKFQIRILEFDSDGTTIKRTKNSNVYPNSDNFSFEQLWENIKGAVENGKK
jgi:hypothetical protein